MLATQNPIEHEGTYPLPEAQVDRFMFKLVVTYPERREEREVLDRMTGAGGARRRAGCWIPSGCSQARRLVQRGVHRRADQGVRARPRRRDPRSPADAGLGRARAADRVRRVAPGGDLPAARGQGARLHPGPRLRHARRHQGARPRRAPPSRDPHLPRRCRGRGTGRAAAAGSSRRCRCHDARGGHARGPADRDHHPPPGARHRGRRILQRLPRPRGGVRRGARVSAGRRRPHHRLERHRPARLRLRQAVPRGAGARRCSSWWT